MTERRTSPPGFEDRTSGLLLHPTSLPGPYGHGDLGVEAHGFVDFLAAAGQHWWQMLPVGPSGIGDSPYQSLSSFAGHPSLVSLEGLAEQGLLEPGDLEGMAACDPGRADFAAATVFREGRLRRACTRFEASGPAAHAALDTFLEARASWLPDYALFRALKRKQEDVPWTSWDAGLRGRDPAELARARRELAEDLRYEVFVQFAFERQWEALRARCRERGIALMGDVPIFVAPDSADVWAHPDLFHLDEEGRPTVVAGVPPDYFSETGQLWGNPLYRWERHREDGYAWWTARLDAAFARFDAVRLDHFIGFHRYWEIPRDAETAATGRWLPGPREDFFETVLKRLGRRAFVAEDLGAVTAEVVALRDRFGFPGMKILQFAFGPGDEAGRPHRFREDAVVYTGTHDNDTSAGWFQALADGALPWAEATRAMVLRYLDSDGSEIHWDLIRMAWLSAANTAIAPVQDLLGLGSDARMNHPGSKEGNWTWRMLPGALGEEVLERLGMLTETYGRRAAQGGTT